MACHGLTVVPGSAGQGFPGGPTCFGGFDEQSLQYRFHLLGRTLAGNLARELQVAFSCDGLAASLDGYREALQGLLIWMAQIDGKAHFCRDDVDRPWPDIPLPQRDYGGSSFLLHQASDLYSHQRGPLQGIASQVHRGGAGVVSAPFYGEQE